MTQFEFLSVFISIVLAFAVSDILSSWGEQIRLRKILRHYPLHSAWTVLVLVIVIQSWWALWLMSDHGSWTFPEYASLILPYLLIALIAYTLTPSFDADERDIKRYYFDNASWVFALAAAYLASWFVFSCFVDDQGLYDQGSVARLVGFLLMIALAIWKNERFHAAAVIAACALEGIWIVMTVFRL